MAMITPTGNTILSCDWGTTNFRLRLVRSDTAAVLDEITTGEGISSVFNAWNISGENRDQYYASVLRKHIAMLQDRSGFNLDNLPVIISGMASSSLGITELPYAGLPFKADGGSAAYQVINVAGFAHEILLCSGVRSTNDVMRGEETQWIGLMQDPAFSGEAELLFVMPGTHSKHILVKDAEIVDFKTYMTGEFFSLLSTVSVLKNSVTVTNSLEHAGDKDAFIKGVRAAKGSNLLHESFMIRTNGLFNLFDKKQNAAYLSGLLIGTELASSPKQKLVLAAGGALSELYLLALEQGRSVNEYKLCSPSMLDKSVINGQLTIFKKITGAR